MNRYRIVAGIAIAALLLCLLPRLHGVAAQTSDQLSALALSPDDVPGFVVASEDPSPVGGYAAAFTRVLTATDGPGSGNAQLTVTLLALADAPSLAAAHAAAASGSLLSDRFGGEGAFQAGGPLGVGDIDTSASWQQTAGEGSVQDVYGDAFVRGRIVAIVTLATDPAQADPNAIAGYAQQQDAKLQAAALAPAATPAPSATPAASGTPAPSAPAAGTGPTPPVPGSVMATPPAATSPLATDQGLAAIALQQSDLPAYQQADEEFATKLPAEVLAGYLSVWVSVGTSNVTAVTDVLTTFDNVPDATLSLGGQYQVLKQDSTVLNLANLGSPGVGDQDYAVVYSYVGKQSGQTYSVFEEFARRGTTLIDVQVSTVGGSITVNDPVRYAKIIDARIVAARH